MSASRVGKASLKKAKMPVSGIQGGRGKSPKVENTSKPPPTKPPRKRANPHIDNFRAKPQSMSPRLMTVFGVSFLGIGTYCGYLFASYKREVAYSKSLEVSKDVSDRYNQTARQFDADVDLSEYLMGMGSKRRDLIQMARGNVLEVSCGTGRNLSYYELPGNKSRPELEGCRTVTFVDLSPQMVEITKEKFEKMYPGMKRAAFWVKSAGEVPPPSWGKEIGKEVPYYDTIVQTMGICSMPNPAETLRHLGSITEPENGRILLLEHGRSYYGWMNNILDNTAAAHADRHGCWWNRDIGEIVRESGLEIVEAKRWHFGTTWKYVLRPRRKDMGGS